MSQQGFEYIVDLGKKEQTKQGKEPSAVKTRASRPKHITPEILSVQMITDEKIVSQYYVSVILGRRTQKYLAKVQHQGGRSMQKHSDGNLASTLPRAMPFGLHLNFVGSAEVSEDSAFL
jgi:hypothetical protein